MSLKKPRIVLAGQIPPPLGGQNIMIEKAVVQFAASDKCESVHLPFFFTPDFKGARKASVGKLVELIRVIIRLWQIRFRGPIDLLLFPTGGPQTTPMLRDLLLLPWALLLSRRVVLHFHAAGIADELGKGKWVARCLARMYGQAFAALVNSDFNRRDPEAVLIKNVRVVPCRVEDTFDPSLVDRGGPGKFRILSVGHICLDKGTPQLLDAFAEILPRHPNLELELVGECLAPFTDQDLQRRIDRLGIRSSVRVSGILRGRAKAAAFGRASLFVFPTVAPYESFGLVLAEAMEWGLPIVASNWRGNSDVLTPQAGAICFPVSANLASDIATALEQAIARRAEWPDWGKANRHIFEQRYREDGTPWLVEPVLSMVRIPGAAST